MLVQLPLNTPNDLNRKRPPQAFFGKHEIFDVNLSILLALKVVWHILQNILEGPEKKYGHCNMKL